MKRVVFLFFLSVLIMATMPAYAQYSNFHTEHIGEIVFAAEPIMPGNEDNQKLKTAFAADEPIFAMAYFDKPFNQLADKVYLGITVWVDGQKQTLTFTKPSEDERYAFYFIKNQYKDKANYPIEVKPSAKYATNEVEVEGWAHFLKGLSPSGHTIKIQLRHPGGALAEGTIKLDWSGFDAAQFQSYTDKVVETIATSHAKSVKLPDHFSESSRMFVDPEMTVDQIKFKLLLSDEFKNCKTIEKVLVGEGDDWRILRDRETSRPKYKVNDRPIRLVYKGKDGWCYYVDKIYFSRSYQDGAYSSPKFVKATRHIRINCRNIK